MTKRYNVVQAKHIEGRDKPYWQKIGRAFERDGKGISIKMDVLPLTDRDGDIWLRLFEDDGQGPSATSNSFSQQSNGSGAEKSDLNDEIPF